MALCALLLAWLAPTAAAMEPGSGRLERITVHGTSLEANLSGDSADRIVFVYLPPGYDTDTARRYPVVYFLHGILARAEDYVRSLDWPASIDRAVKAGELQQMIFVLPDAMTLYGGSMYSNSPTTGDWETFIARDLVAYVDAHYRTIARRESRGLAGHSMGGYGTLRIGMKYPGQFAALYSMSACCLDPRRTGQRDASLEQLKTREDLEKLPMFGRLTLAVAAAWAPDVRKPPFYLDLPTRDGQPQADVLARFAANSPAAMVSQYAPQLRRYRSIVMDVGDKDNIASGNEETHQALERVGVAHEFRIYDGDHMNRVPGRFAEQVVPFFARQLQPTEAR